ncbi:MAG: NAD(P)-dependent oxidoreductase [Candidatus Omnitrophota bacterium]
MKKHSSMHKKESILITGAGGFIGSHLLDYLKNNYTVFCVDSKPVRCVGCRSITFDLRNRKRVCSYFRRFKKKNTIRVIVHLASRVISVKNARDMDIFYDNIKITEGVVEIAKILKPEKIIHFSSIAVYPNKTGRYSEASLTHPAQNSDCLYGLSKLCSENIFDFLLRDEKIKITHLRAAQVYGKGMRNDRIIPIMLKELEKRKAITVFGNGERTISFIEVKKLILLIHFFIVHDAIGVINVGNEHLSLLTLARRLIKQYGNKQSKIIKKPQGSREKFYLVIKKLNRLLADFKK